MNGQPLRGEQRLEFGFFSCLGNEGGGSQKTGIGLCGLLDLVEIGCVVGGDMQGSARFERAMDEGEKFRLNEAATMMLAFRPRVREEEEKGAHGAGRQQVFQRVGGFGVQQAEIGQVRLFGAAPDFDEAAVLDVGPDPVAFRMPDGACQEKAAFPAAEIDFDRGGSAEKTGQIKRRRQEMRGKDHAGNQRPENRFLSRLKKLLWTASMACSM